MATFFRIALWKKNLARFWPLAAVGFLAALFIFVVPEASSSRISWALPRQKDIISDLATYCAAVVPMISIFSAIAVFGYLHNPRASGFVSSLPLTRLDTYIINWLSGLTLALVPALLAGALYGALLIGQPVPSGDYLRWLGALISSYVMFFSMASFFAFLTGNPIMQAVLYGIFNLLYLILYGIVSFLAQTLVFGYSSYGDHFFSVLSDFLTPAVVTYNMIDNMTPYARAASADSFSVQYAALFWAVYLAVAMSFVVFGYLLYRRRHIEAAGNVILHKPIRSVFKYLVGFLTGGFLAYILIEISSGSGVTSSSAPWLAALTMFFGSLGCLFAEMLIQKRLRVWKTAYKGIIGFVAAIAAITLFIRLDGTGYENRIPNPNDVVSVSFSQQFFRNNSPLYGKGNEYYPGGEGWSLQRTYVEQRQALGLPIYSDEVLHEIKLRTPDYFESPEAIAAAVRSHQEIISKKRNLESLQYMWNWSGVYYLTYMMKDGSTMVRQYVLPTSKTPVDSTVTLLLELLNQPEAVGKRNRFAAQRDDAFLGALITPAHDGVDIWNRYSLYSNRIRYGAMLLPEDGLVALTQALRQDASSGTLGRLRQNDLNAYYSRDRSSVICVIDIIVDQNAAGAPAAFERDQINDEDGNPIASGLVQTVLVTKEHINTIRVLGELGLLDFVT